MPRRTLKEFDFENYPAPAAVYESLTTGVYREETVVRDRALIALLYLGALRISEALRITKEQFQAPSKGKIVIAQVQVSKKKFARSASSMRSVWLPLKGERAPFTGLVMAWVDQVPSGRIFVMCRKTGYNITNGITGKWNHYYRALGEAYLYDKWGRDILAVADYVNVRSTMLEQYIRRAYRGKRAV